MSQVSVRFRRLATADYSLWKGCVVIYPNRPVKAKFVVQKCLNSGTREFVMEGSRSDRRQVLISQNPEVLYVVVSV